MPATGRITQVIGSTFDAEFPAGQLPNIYNAVKVHSHDGSSKIEHVARHIRIRQTGSNSKYHWSIYEFDVYAAQ